MLRAWCFLDRDRFNVQTMQTVLEGLASRKGATETRTWQEFAEIVLADTEVLALWACGAIFLLALKCEGSARFVCTGCYLVTGALCIFLYREFHLPARVYCPAFAACAFVSLVVSAGPRSIGKGVTGLARLSRAAQWPCCLRASPVARISCTPREREFCCGVTARPKT